VSCKSLQRIAQVLIWVSMRAYLPYLATFASLVLLSGCGSSNDESSTTTSTTKVPDFVAVDGIFSDPNHFEAGTWKGVRAIVTGMGEVAWENLFLIGTDDGENWFTLVGGFDKDGKDFYIDFSSKGGPKNLEGEYANGTITFSDGNKWTRMVDQSCSKILASQILSPSPTNGVYRDVNCSDCGKDSWEKVRFVSDMLGDTTEDHLYIIGSDDGSDFWFATGDVDRTAGTVRVDLSLVDGPIVDASWDAEGISGEGLEWKHLDEPCSGTPTMAHV